MVIANLCVSYIMATQNEEAEEIMRKLEREEDKSAIQDPEKNVSTHTPISLLTTIILIN
jgi:tetratricopeptide repeat protein 30